MEKNVLNAWKKERDIVERGKNTIIRKGQIKKFDEHLKDHNKMVRTEVFANTDI